MPIFKKVGNYLATPCPGNGHTRRRTGRIIAASGATNTGACALLLLTEDSARAITAIPTGSKSETK